MDPERIRFWAAIVSAIVITPFIVGAFIAVISLLTSF